MFSNFKLSTSSGKHVEVVSHVHLVSLKYKLITSSKDSDDLSIGFDRSHNRRRDELAKNKNVKSKYHPRIILKDVFGFAECQEKCSFGLGYKLTLRRNKDQAVTDKANGFADARFKSDQIGWWVPHYTPSLEQQIILMNQILKKVHTQLRYIERSVFMKEVNKQKLWNFELGAQETMDVPIWIIFGSHKQDRQDSQNLNNDTFCRLPVVSAQCTIGTEKYPDTEMLINYDNDDYVQGYHQIKEAFKNLTKHKKLQLYITDDDFRSSNAAAKDVGYNLYVFDISYQKNYTASQSTNVAFKFDGVVPPDTNGYALVLTHKLISTSSDGNGHFDLI